MTATYAEALGRIAFTEGRGPQAFADPAIASEIADAKVGEKTHILKAWSKGWNAANIEAAW